MNCPILSLAPIATMSRFSPVARFFRLSLANKLVLAEALACLAVASVAIRFAPFRSVVATMRVGGPGRMPDERVQQKLVAQCRWAVTWWADRVPWRAVCFQRGLALHWMLRRRAVPCVLHYGVSAAAPRGLAAHVWLSHRGEVILGGDVAEDYACLATFPPAPAEAGPLPPLRAAARASE